MSDDSIGERIADPYTWWEKISDFFFFVFSKKRRLAIKYYTMITEYADERSDKFEVRMNSIRHKEQALWPGLQKFPNLYEVERILGLSMAKLPLEINSDSALTQQVVMWRLENKI